MDGYISVQKYWCVQQGQFNENSCEQTNENGLNCNIILNILFYDPYY